MLVRTVHVAFLTALLSLASPAQSGELQRATAQAMQGHRGTVVVIDVASNRVLASVNLAGAARRVVRPGSTVKPFTLLALLTNGVVEPNAAISCRSELTVGGHRLDCAHPRNTGALDAVSALAYSCNDYFTTMAARLTPAQLRQAFLKAGFAGPSGLTPHEAAGQIALSATREQLQMQAIGIENVRATPLAMLHAYREFAMLPGRSGDAAHETVLRGLEAAVAFGVARLAQPPGPMPVAGKTGTARADEGQWTHGWFVGYAPANKPEIALVVFLERGTGPGGAAPIAGKIFAAYAQQRRR